MPGATFTPITLKEMDSYLKRAFRALRPTPANVRGELAYDLFLNDAKTIGIRVMTSIGHGSQHGDAKGEDAIRVGFFNFAGNHPMITGKFPIVKRTQGWRDSLKDRIEDYIEMYEEKEDYWESRAGNNYAR